MMDRSIVKNLYLLKSTEGILTILRFTIVFYLIIKYATAGYQIGWFATIGLVLAYFGVLFCEHFKENTKTWIIVLFALNLGFLALYACHIFLQNGPRIETYIHIFISLVLDVLLHALPSGNKAISAIPIAPSTIIKFEREKSHGQSGLMVIANSVVAKVMQPVKGGPNRWNLLLLKLFFALVLAILLAMITLKCYKERPNTTDIMPQQIVDTVISPELSVDSTQSDSTHIEKAETNTIQALGGGRNNSTEKSALTEQNGRQKPTDTNEKSTLNPSEDNKNRKVASSIQPGEEGWVLLKSEINGKTTSNFDVVGYDSVVSKAPVFLEKRETCRIYCTEPTVKKGKAIKSFSKGNTFKIIDRAPKQVCGNEVVYFVKVRKQ